MGTGKELVISKIGTGKELVISKMGTGKDSLEPDPLYCCIRVNSMDATLSTTLKHLAMFWSNWHVLPISYLPELGTTFSS